MNSSSPPSHLAITEAVSLADITRVRRLFQEYAAGLGFSLCFQNFEHELASLPGDYSRPRGRLLLASVGNQLAGCVALHPLSDSTPASPETNSPQTPPPQYCEMKRLYVRPEFRGQRAGYALAQRVIAEARAIGYSHMRLDTIASTMRSAVELYRTLGFKEISSYRENPISEALFMELQL